MTTPDEDRVTQPGDDWLTIEEAAEAYGVSQKTIRRRAQSGQLEAAKTFDESVGGERWMVAPPETRRAEVVPVEVLDRLEELHRRIADERARAEVAERTIEFERERRTETERARAEAEAEAERLRAALETERSRRWWQRRR